MKIAAVVAVTVLCLLSGGPVVGQSSTKETAVEKQITETLHQMYEAEKRKDLKFVLSHLADDFAEVAGDGGVYHRTDIEAGWTDVVLRDYKLLPRYAPGGRSTRRERVEPDDLGGGFGQGAPLVDH